MKAFFLTWLFWNAVLGGGLLMIGCVIAAATHSPIRRLRLLEWTLLVSVMAPLLASTTFSWQVSLRWLPAEQVSDKSARIAGGGLPPTQNQTVKAEASRPVQTDPADRPTKPLGSSAPLHTRWGNLLVGVEAGALILMASWWLLGTVLLRRIWASAKPEDLEIHPGGHVKTPVEVRSHPKILTPCAFGIRRWHILLPWRIAESKSGQSLQFALRHECSHLQHGHLWTWQLTRLAQAALWFQPAYWWLRRQIRLCQDYLADDEASSVGSRADFATFLVEIARKQQTLPAGAALPLISRSSDLSRRVSMLLESDAPLENRCPRSIQMVAACCAVLVLTVIATIRLEAQNAAPAAAPSDRTRTARDAGLAYRCRVVTYGTEAPIEAARVVVEQSLVGDPRYPDEEVLQTTEHTTDAEGYYSFNISDEHASERYLYVKLDVSHPDHMAKRGFGYSMTMIRRNEAMGGRPFFERIKLHPAEPVTGRLLTPQGEPAANVEILGYTYPGDKPYFDGEVQGSFFETMTDDEGQFRVNIATPGQGAFWFRPQDYAPLGVVAPWARGEMGDLKLKSGLRVSGRLLDAEGRPATNMPITVYRRDRESPDIDAFNRDSMAMGGYTRKVVTDSKGNYKLPPVDPGRYEFRIRQEPESEVPGAFLNRRISITEDGQRIDFQALPTVEIRVRNVDSAGNPDRGFEFHVSGFLNGGRDWFNTRSNRPSDGRTMAKIPKGMENVQLRFFDNEHGSFRIRRSAGAKPEAVRDIMFENIDSDREGIEVIRYDAPVILIKSVDDDGKPVRDIEVSATYREPGVEDVSGEVRFEEQDDGRWRSKGLLPDVETTITLTKPGWTSEKQVVSLAEGEEQELVIQMTP